MKLLLSFVCVCVWMTGFAQQEACMQKLLSAPGTWGQISRSERAAATALPTQKNFVNALNANLEMNYTPRNLQADRSVWHEPLQQGRPVASYGLTLYGMQYSCKGNELSLNHETSTTMAIGFNQFNDAELYETSNDYILTGYHRLMRGLPVEVKPGIWQFPDQRASLGFGVDGNSKAWLITHDGKLPWSNVTRKEFLLKRRQNLQRQMDEEAPRLKEQLRKWDTEKKFKEQEWKNDAAKLSNYMTVTYNPGVEREQANYKRAMEGWTQAIQRVEQQLQGSATELDKPAIVIRSQGNFRDYDFADKVEPMSEVLVKPNPAYFNRTLAPSVPQFIRVEIIANPKDSVAARFVKDVQYAINLDYLKSFIGKSAPGVNPGRNGMMAGSAPNKSMNATSPTPASTTSSQTSAVSTSSSAKTTNTSGTTNNSSANQNANTKTSGKTFALSGTLSAPVGAPVTLSYNGANDVTVTPPKSDQSVYKTIPVKFTTAIAEGAAYKVELKKLAANMRGIVYRGNGSAPADIDKIRVAVDYQYELLTRSSDDKVKSTFYESYTPVVGGYRGEEGRYVVFVSLTKNLEGSDGKFRQIFWRDRNTGITRMISRAASGEQANGDCTEPSITADGQTVVFESRATNLVGGDNNNVKDIFIWKASDNSIALVSKAVNGGIADAESFDAMISGNGQHVVFTSLAGNLSSTAKGRSVANVFLRDLQSERTEMISVDPVTKTGGNGYKASISFDGSRVSFCSASNTLVPNDNNGLWDIFVWQRGQSSLKRISLTHDGKERNAGSESSSRQVASSISGNGKFVAFATTASNMVPGDNNTFQDAFVVDVDNGKVSVASFTDDGQPSNGDSPIEQGERIAISYDGTWVAFPTKATNLGTAPSNIILHNTVTGKKQIVSDVKGTYVARPAMSYSGSYIIFGKASKLDNRFSDTGIFAHFTGNGPCRDCKE